MDFLILPDVDFKPAYWNRKNSYKRLRSDRNYPFKKRKFFDCISVSNSDEGISSECVSDAPEKGIIGDDFGSHPKTHEGFMHAFYLFGFWVSVLVIICTLC